MDVLDLRRSLRASAGRERTEDELNGKRNLPEATAFKLALTPSEPVPCPQIHAPAQTRRLDPQSTTAMLARLSASREGKEEPQPIPNRCLSHHFVPGD